jgi:hypothetical protein
LINKKNQLHKRTRKSNSSQPQLTGQTCDSGHKIRITS